MSKFVSPVFGLACKVSTDRFVFGTGHNNSKGYKVGCMFSSHVFVFFRLLFAVVLLYLT